MESKVPGYTMAKSEDIDDFYSEPCIGACIGAFGCLFSAVCCPLTLGICCNPYKTVQKGFTGIITRFGRVQRIVQEGLHPVNVFAEKLTTIDSRTVVLELKKQTVLTRDNLSLTIDGVIYYTIVDLDKAIFKVQDLTNSIHSLALVALRAAFGTKDLQNCLEHRDELAREMFQFIAAHVSAWGIKVDNLQITDMTLPDSLQKMLQSAATAEKEGRAKIVLAQADVQSARLMREAAEALNSDAAMQIRLLETYNKVAESENAHLIFMPLDKLRSDEKNEILQKLKAIHPGLKGPELKLD